nr:hypothetical protein [Bacteroidota bacterium]
MRKIAIQEFEDSRNLLTIINSIYQHPTMAEYFGLIQNFYIPLDEENIGDYFTKESDSFLVLKIKENNDNHFQLVGEKKGAIPQAEGGIILDLIKVHAEIFNGKYYHGLPNYGLVKNNEIEYEFSNVSYDNQLQNDKLVNDAVNETNQEGKSLIQLSSIKRKVTEGIYMFQVVNEKKKYLEDLNELPSNVICEIEKIENGNTTKIKVQNIEC